MVKLAEGYISPGQFKFVKFDKDIVSLEDSKIVFDEEKLINKLAKEMDRDPRVIGIVDGRSVFITLYDNGTFTGRVWSANQNLSGTYEVT